MIGLAALLLLPALAAPLVWPSVPQDLARWLGLAGPGRGPSAVQPRPTVAVLPFENRGGEAGEDYFSDGVTEDVITDLGRFGSLQVLSWSAVAPYRNQRVAPGELSRALNVRYVVGGTLRRSGDRVRVTVQLTDADAGVLLWSERYDEKLDDIFAVQDGITRQVVAALAGRVTALETARAARIPTADLDAYDLVLRARDLMRRLEREANFQSRAMFAQARTQDPNYVDGYVGEGSTHLNDFRYGWTEWPDRALDSARAAAERAIALDERNAAAHVLLADVLLFEGDHERAGREIGRAIDLNPNDALGRAIHGKLLLNTGMPDAGAAAIELALRLNPNPEAWWVENLARAYYFLARDEDVVDLLDQHAGLLARDPAAQAVMAAANGQLGRSDEASAALARLRRISPFFDLQIFARNLAATPAHAARLRDGLRKAGLGGSG